MNKVALALLIESMGIFATAASIVITSFFFFRKLRCQEYKRNYTIEAGIHKEAGAKMEKYYQDYMDRLEELHREIANAIRGLPQEALDWVPGRKMNSMAVLVVHLIGAERYWIGDVAGGDRSGRVRSDEFLVRGLTDTELIERLEQVEAHSRGILERLAGEDLVSLRTSPRDERPFTLGWSILHALEHTAIHLGHIQLARQMWEQVNGGGE